MKKSELAFTIALVPLDLISLIAAGIVAYEFRFHPYFTAIRPVIFQLTLSQYFPILISALPIWLLVFATAGLYSIRRKSIAKELIRVILATSAAMAIVFAILFFSRTLFDSRFIALAAWILSILFVCFGRLILRGLQRSFMEIGIGVHHVGIVGGSEIANDLKTLFDKHPRLGYRVIETEKNFSESVAKKFKLLINQNKLDDIILADPSASKETVLNLIAFTDEEHVGFRYSADLFATAIGKTIFHMYAGIPVIEVQKTPLDGWGAIYKRLFDIIASLLLILLTSPPTQSHKPHHG